MKKDYLIVAFIGLISGVNFFSNVSAGSNKQDWVKETVSVAVGGKSLVSRIEINFDTKTLRWFETCCWNDEKKIDLSAVSEVVYQNFLGLLFLNTPVKKRNSLFYIECYFDNKKNKMRQKMPAIKNIDFFVRECIAWGDEKKITMPDGWLEEWSDAALTTTVTGIIAVVCKYEQKRISSSLIKNWLPKIEGEENRFDKTNEQKKQLQMASNFLSVFKSSALENNI
ncbi:MAG: hypothetical protein JW725_03675 [Candidatus Babeliaceae bacterium]|nr:hypothetical protein [Candidatus Babeliaceae bacterium]